MLDEARRGDYLAAMNQFSQELMNALDVAEPTSEGRIRARFVLSEEFVGLQGHFPGNPVLPGIALVRLVLALLERVRQEPVELLEIVRVKYLKVVVPGAVLELELELQQVDSGRVKARITEAGTRVAEMQLRVRRAEQREVES